MGRHGWLGDVVVAVIDSGMLPHPDITSRLVPGADLITSPSISNDGDGRDGDNTDPGDTCGGVPSSWHGLHVAGTIGATTDNGLGIAGVDQRARVLPVRALGTCGGWASDIADAIRWAAGLPVPGVPPNPTPAKVLNLSLGGPGALFVDRAVRDRRCSRRRATVVAAVGQLGVRPRRHPVRARVVQQRDRCRSHDQVRRSRRLLELRVGRRHRRSGRSQARPPTPKASCRCRTLGPRSADLSPTGWTYSSKQGTSMAAPHVSGVISLMLAANPTLSPAQIEQILKQTARPFSPSPRGADIDLLE